MGSAYASVFANANVDLVAGRAELTPKSVTYAPEYPRCFLLFGVSLPVRSASEPDEETPSSLMDYTLERAATSSRIRLERRQGPWRGRLPLPESVA